MSQTLILIKPDAFTHRLVGWCIACFEPQIRDLKMVWLNEPLCWEHYSEHVMRDYFPNIVAHMTSGPSLAMVVEGVHEARGQALEIRKKWPGYCEGPRNLIHSSDSIASAQRELDLWFPERPIRWNPYNKVVSDRRDGTVDLDATNVIRDSKGLPVPWSHEIAAQEIDLKPVF